MAGLKRQRVVKGDAQRKRGKIAHDKHASKTAKARPKKGAGAQQAKGWQAVLPPVVGDATDSETDMVDAEDIEFVNAYGKRLGFLTDLDAAKLQHTDERSKGPGPYAAKSIATVQRNGAAVDEHSVDASDEELDGVQTGKGSDVLSYEAAPRHPEREIEKRAAPLPLKTMTGKLFTPLEGKVPNRIKAQTMQVPVVQGIDIADPAAEGVEDPASTKAPTSGKKGKAARKEERKQRKQEAKAVAQAKADAGESDDEATDTAPAFATREQRVAAARLQIAAAARKLLEDPEENVANLKLLNTLAADADQQVARLALLSSLAVYRDILPGYRIRLPTEAEMAVKVSKDVAKLRKYESTLLGAYQVYLKMLLKLVKGGSVSSQRVGLHAMCLLLTRHPHFNYASDLLQLVVSNMVHRDADIAGLCCDTVQHLLSSDLLGQLSLEAVQLVADLVKLRKCVGCRPAVLQCLLAINTELLQDPVGAASTSRLTAKQKKQLARKKKKGKVDAVDAAFAESKATPDREERHRLQSLTLEALFEVFFRVLKHATASASLTGAAAPMQPAAFKRKFPLLRVALKGLRRYAHLIDVDYFESLVAVLTQLVQSPRMPTAEKLHILLAASHIARGQGKALTLDRAQLYASLQSTLEELTLAREDAVVPEGLSDDDDEDGRIDDRTARNTSSSKSQCATQTTPSLAAEATELWVGTLLDQKSLDQARLSAFTKALCRGAVSVADTGMAVGCLVVAQRLLRRHTALRGLLEDPASGPVVHTGGGTASWTIAKGNDDETDDGITPASKQAGAPLWELSLLSQHYHPHIATAATALARLTDGQNPTSQCAMFMSYHTPEEAAEAYDTSLGSFRPPPHAPAKLPQHSGRPIKGSVPSEAVVCARLTSTASICEAGALPSSPAGAAITSSSRQAQPDLSDNEQQTLQTAFQHHYRMTRLFREHEQLRREDTWLQRMLHKVTSRPDMS